MAMTDAKERKQTQLEVWQGLPKRSPKSLYLMVREGNKMTALAKLTVSWKVFRAAVIEAEATIIPALVDNSVGTPMSGINVVGEDGQ